jgi:spore photoproduct lyase
MKLEKVFRKDFSIKVSGRSTDFISPSFIYECAYNCSYCYVKRHNQKSITVAKNNGDILSAINNHALFNTINKPNQTHEKFISYDLGCNSDLALHAKNLNWQYIFDFFKNHDIAFGSFATKYVNKELLTYNPNKKIRIRFSLMPQNYSNLLEPNTSKIIDRIKAINDFIDAGYDVHINFSPVIVTENWLEEYKILFDAVNDIVKEENKQSVKAEVIFLTHNNNKHLDNLKNNLTGEELLWNPEIQENKISQYGGLNIRYKHYLKSQYIEQFKKVHNKVIFWNKIRYIF